MPLFQTQGRTLHYNIENNAFSDDVLFIHGNLASARWWQPTIQFLERQRQENMHGRLVSVDWPGCGESLAPTHSDDLSMYSLAKDHIALAKSCGLNRVRLVGHSAGGLIALLMLLLEPDLFSRAILLDPVGATGFHASPEMLEGFKQMSQDRRFCEIILGGAIYGREVSEPYVQKLVDDAFGVDSTIWTEVPRHMAAVDIRKDLPNIMHPILVLHGERDKVLPIEDSREIALRVVQGQFEMLPGRGHCSNVEDPAMFAARVQEFFAD